MSAIFGREVVARDTTRGARLSGGAVLLAGLVACADAAQQASPQGLQPPLFDPAALAAGDTLMGLRVAEIDVRPDAVDGFGWSGYVRFDGEVELAGAYHAHPEYPEVDASCFFPDSLSSARLPRFPNDRRYSWFCFTNAEEARASLGGPLGSGRASIVIDQFEYRYQHTDTYNTARLSRLAGGSSESAGPGP